MRRQRFHNGLTLIELLIVVAIIGIMVPVLYDCMVEPMYTYKIESIRRIQSGDMSNVHRMMDRDIRCAAGVIPAMDTITSDSQSLILEVPIIAQEVENMEAVRIHYHFSTDSAAEASGLVLWRDVYQESQGEWQKAMSYPLSREAEQIRFAPVHSGWEMTKLIRVRLKYQTSAAHKELALDQVKFIALRGGR